MKHFKLFTSAVVQLCSCAIIALLLTSCAEQQIVMNPDETAPQANPEIVSLMKTSGSILEGAEIRKESGKTIIKPKKKITLKEFLASQPYKLTLDNSVPQPKSAPCNYRWSYYKTLERFEPAAGKTVGFFLLIQVKRQVGET